MATRPRLGHCRHWRSPRSASSLATSRRARSALQEAFGEHGVPPTHANVFGVLSLTFWSLIGVVSGKYVLFIMRANNMIALAAIATVIASQAVISGAYSMISASVHLGRDKLFAYLARNAMPATAYFHVPANRLIEIGRRVSI